MSRARARNPLVPHIAKLACQKYNINMSVLVGSRRDFNAVNPRQIVCYLASKEAGMSLPAIGRYLGNRDHTTILHSVRKVSNEVEKYPNGDVAGVITEIKTELIEHLLAEYSERRSAS
jgi:chromosomal replication initiator protein